MNAHIAIVFTRYMMLAVKNRQSIDDRTLGELVNSFLLTLPKSIKGNVSKTNQIKRDMYGRASYELLRKKVM